MPFRTALSGLNAASAELRVIGHNVANAATTGFKKSRAEFADIFATSSLGVTSNAIGSGVRIASVSQQFSQGNIGFTDNNLDLAVSGQGFFIVADGGVNSYTRAGQFGVDRDGFVVNNAGSHLVVFQADNAGNITGAQGDLQLDTADIAPQATTLVDFGLNLDASATVPVTAAATSQVDLVGNLDADDAAGAPYVMAPFTVYDSYGTAHTATITYTQTAVDNQWDMSLDIDGAFTNNHTVTFNSQGVLSLVDGAVPNASRTVSLGSFDPGTGADPVQITASLASLAAATNGVAGNANAVTPTVVNNTAQVYNAVFPAGARLDGDHAIGNTVTTPTQNYTDSLGNNHTADYTFSKTGANTWNLLVDIDGGAQTQTYNLTFPAGGGTVTAPATSQYITFTPGGGAAEMVFEVDVTNMQETAPVVDKTDTTVAGATYTNNPGGPVYNAIFGATVQLDGDHAIGDSVTANVTAPGYTDDQGVNHPAAYVFTKTGADTWNVDVRLDGASVAVYPLVFNAGGTVASLNGNVAGTQTLNIDPDGGGAAAAINIDIDVSAMLETAAAQNTSDTTLAAASFADIAADYDFNLTGTLDSNDVFGGPSYSPATFNLVDSSGANHTATVTYTHNTNANEWNMNISIAGGAAAYSQDYTLVFDADGTLSTINGAAPGVLNLPTFNPAVATAAQMQISFDPSTMTAVTDGANGNAAIASANVNGAAQSVFDAGNANTYNSSTSLTIFDSLGSSHLATTYYRKTPTPNQWETYTFVDGTQVDGPTIMAFSSQGTITTPAAPAQIAIAAFNPGGGAANLSLRLDYSDATQFGSNFSVNALTQDGYTTGRLSGIDIADTGVITSRFTNGQSRTIGQVALANFANTQGLRQLGGTTWAESFESGAALVSAPGSGSLGTIQSGALEGSNVDLTEQLVGLITAQRNFQANAQVITTADTITQTIINIR